MAETPPPLPSWSDIPLELAGLVLGRLPAHADRVRFAAVCPQWRRAAREVVPLPAPLPLLALPDGTVYSLPGTEPFRFPGCSGYGDASGSWLAFSDDDGCFLRNPFTNATVTLPLRFRVRSHRRRAGEEETEVEWMEIEDAAEQLTMYKLVCCSPQLIAASITFQRTTQVAVCQPGADSWWSVHTEEFPLLADMTFQQENLYVTDYFEALFMIDISLDGTTGDPWVSRVRRSIGYPCHLNLGTGENVIVKMLYLIELHGELLMVRRKIHSQRKTPIVAAGPCPWYGVIDSRIYWCGSTRVKTFTVCIRKM
jgi:hypothetical protein